MSENIQTVPRQYWTAARVIYLIRRSLMLKSKLLYLICIGFSSSFVITSASGLLFQQTKELEVWAAETGWGLIKEVEFNVTKRKWRRGWNWVEFFWYLVWTVTITFRIRRLGVLSHFSTMDEFRYQQTQQMTAPDTREAAGCWARVWSSLTKTRSQDHLPLITTCPVHHRTSAELNQ